MIRNQTECIARELRQQLLGSDPLERLGRVQRESDSPWKREHLPDRHSAQEDLEGRTPVLVFDILASCLQQSSVLNSARTGRFASAAPQTKVNVADTGIAQREPACLQRAHNVDATTWRIVFVAIFQVRWTRPKAQAAMHAGKCLRLIQEW